MSAFFRAASGCIGPLLFGCSRSQRSPLSGCRENLPSRAACSDSGRERRAFPEILTARGCHSVRMASVSGLPPPRRRPGSRRLHDLDLRGGKHPPVSARVRRLRPSGPWRQHAPFSGRIAPQGGTFRGKQKMAANKKINNFSSKAPPFQLSTPQGGPPLRCFT